ncbi:MAG: S8 family serine peptidase [Mycetocola sp.]
MCRAVLVPALLVGVSGAVVPVGSAVAHPIDQVVASSARDDDVRHPGRYIVRVSDQGDPSSENGGSSPERDQARHDRQNSVAGDAGVTITASFVLTLNAFSADLSEEQLRALESDDRVTALEPEQNYSIQAAPSADTMNLSGYGGLWSRLGGITEAGKGTVIGVLDSGIAPENPSFDGDALGSTAGDEPYRDGESIVFTKADGTTFRGTCETGEQFDGSECNQTLIGARYFLDGVDTRALGDADDGEYRSPRDGSGHGSHTAAIAAGRESTVTVAEQSQTITGVAPAAKIAAYKVCWSGQDPHSDADDICPSSAILAGIEQAVADGVDVINYSVGAPPEKGVALSAVDEAFLGASNAGVFVAAAAGNSGPREGTVSNTAPWVTTVAATTQTVDEATVRLGERQAMPGASISVPRGESIRGPLLLAPFVGHGNRAISCAPNTLTEGEAQGGIIVCERNGKTSLTQMAAEVKRVGGRGLVALNVDDRPTEVGDFGVPTVNLSVRYRTSVKRAASEGEPTATLQQGNTTSMKTEQGADVRSDSSRGPAHGATADVLKPDLSAPGTGIFSASSAAQGAKPHAAAMSGTSMAAPHVAGLAALLLARTPSLTPAVIKSTLMTTALPTLGSTDGPASALAQGSGLVDAHAILTPGLVFDAGADDWAGFKAGRGLIEEDALPDGVEPLSGSELNLPSVAVSEVTMPRTVTRTVTAQTAGTYRLDEKAPDGFELLVSPTQMTLAEGESARVTVTVRRSDAPFGEYRSGEITWSGPSGIHGTMPVAARAVEVSVPARVTGAVTDAETTFPVQMSAGVDSSTTASGLTALTPVRAKDADASAPTAHGGPDTVTDTPIAVPRDVVAARLAVGDVDPGVEARIELYRLNDLAEPVASWSADTDGVIDVLAPPAGKYVLRTVVTRGTGDVTVMQAWAREGRGAQGTTFAVDDSELHGRDASERTVRVDWTGADPATRYVAAVRFGSAGPLTIVGLEPQD